MSTLPALHGKTLPVFFMQGYLDGLWHAVGKGQLIAAYQLAAQELVPDKAMRDRWLDPLLAYFHHGTHDPQPLDYRFVALFQAGFQLNGPQYLKAARVFTRRAGKEWWFGEPPISTYQDETGLQKHFAPRIWAALNPGKFGAPEITSYTVKGYCDLGIIGVTTFLDHFRQESEIAFQVKTDNNSIDIEAIECPFCLHEHDLCYVLAGIVSGLLDWLHGHWGRESTAHQYLTLNDDTSTNHRVVIDIHRYGLNSKPPAAAS
jgi:hypothetical protein